MFPPFLNTPSSTMYLAERHCDDLDWEFRQLMKRCEPMHFHLSDLYKQRESLKTKVESEYTNLENKVNDFLKSFDNEMSNVKRTYWDAILEARKKLVDLFSSGMKKGLAEFNYWSSLSNKNHPDHLLNSKLSLDQRMEMQLAKFTFKQENMLKLDENETHDLPTSLVNLSSPENLIVSSFPDSLPQLLDCLQEVNTILSGDRKLHDGLIPCLRSSLSALSNQLLTLATYVGSCNWEQSLLLAGRVKDLSSLLIDCSVMNLPNLLLSAGEIIDDVGLLVESHLCMELT